jgi:hypothetical protein
MRWSRALLILGGALATAALAAIAPVWTYALSLLLFGLPHVLVELRYVDERFGARLPRTMITWLAIGLAGIAALRLLAVGGIGSSSMRVSAELLLGAGLVAGTVPLLLQRRSVVLAGFLLFVLATGTWLDPVTTLVTLALLHNLTPIGFLAERLRGPERRWAMISCAMVFGVIPLLLLTDAAPVLWTQFSVQPEALGPFGSGSLDAQLPAFVPPPLLGTQFADHLFAAAAYLQCMHYAVVLHVLPRLAGGAETQGATFAWPRPRTFAVAVVGLGAVFSVAFANDFGGTRAVYAVFAAVHAWLEIPVLALACGLTPRHLAAPETRA